MLQKKIQAAPLTVPAFNATDKAPVRPGPVLEAIEHFSNGCQGAPVYGCTGCRFDNGTVLMRTYSADPFHLYLQAGRMWFEVMTVQSNDPAIAALQSDGALVVYGPSPAAEAKRKAKEAEAEERLQAYLAYQRQRGEIKKAERDAAEAAEAKRRAALFN